jgi:hypothetical protein
VVAWSRCPDDFVTECASLGSCREGGGMRHINWAGPNSGNCDMAQQQCFVTVHLRFPSLAANLLWARALPRPRSQPTEMPHMLVGSHPTIRPVGISAELVFSS